MGLSGVKRRNKIPDDPNNTFWSRATDGFGHRILSAQGWKPGQLLGAHNAPHAEHLTAANASHIRVALRADNLGLGAQVGTSDADTFGLSTLSGIFGRLNGKTDVQVQMLQDAQRDIELRTYQSQRFGRLNFVSAGLLVGDQIQEVPNRSYTPGPDALGNDKKRKRIEKDDNHNDNIKAKKSKPSTKSKNFEKQDINLVGPQDDVVQNQITDAETSTAHSTNSRIHEHTVDHEVIVQTRSDRATKALRKAEKRARKESKKKRKAEKTGQVITKSASNKPDSTSESTPSISSKPTHFAGSRHAVRQRYIQQKRLASLDPRALNEILMLKTAIT